MDIGNSESAQIIGKIISTLAVDEHLFENSGKVLIVAQLGLDYGISDIDGKQPGPRTWEDL